MTSWFAEMKHEIDMEPGGDGCFGIASFGYEHGVRIVFGHPAAIVIPQILQTCAIAVATNQRRCHIDPEAVAAEVEPEGHDPS